MNGFSRLSVAILQGIAGSALLILAPAFFPGSSRAAEPLRIGIYHPNPRLCFRQEHSQRDLRVLRLAFGLSGAPDQLLALPWFYRPESDGAADSRETRLWLDARALWEKPGEDGAPSNLPAATPPQPELLTRWRERLADGIEGATTVFEGGNLAIVLPASVPLGSGMDFFLSSRLRQSALLPYREESVLAAAGDSCIGWPAGVVFQQFPESAFYLLRNERISPGPPFVLTGYRSRNRLWRALRRGRLDVAFLEGNDLDAAAENRALPDGGAWGVALGTQQVALAFRGDTAGELGARGRLALSEAINRRGLAARAGPGFAAAEAFFQPVLEEAAPANARGFPWNSLSARRRWLEQPPLQRKIRIAVPAHPVLERLAQEVASQWQKTLNLSGTVQALSPDRFLSAAGGGFDFALSVYDLDNGSLQDLWNSALKNEFSPPENGPPDLSRWEKNLQANLPYLPLLGNLHFFYAPSGPRPITTLCPECRILRA
ncbi:MAG: hypothetical protein IIA14_16535, partial [SAR324 cluster bacterium]|nr:hypothetical protein [SAR324 cluster bacterium]